MESNVIPPETLQDNLEASQGLHNDQIDEKKSSLAEIAQQGLAQYSNATWASLSDREKAEILLAIKSAAESGASVPALVTFYKEHCKKVRKPVPLIQVVKETIQTAINQNHSPRFIVALEWTLLRFANGREEVPIGRVGVVDIEDWFASQRGRNGEKAAVSTIIGLRSKLFSLFAEAVRKDYIEDSANPMHRVLCPKLKLAKQPYWRPPDAHKVLWVCRKVYPRWLGWLTLGLFAAIRPEEIVKMMWSDIDVVRGEIMVDECASKTRRRRFIEISDCGPLMLWLEEANAAKECEYIVPTPGDRNDKRQLDRIDQLIARHRRNLSVWSGVNWPQDILRKTAITYLTVFHRNVEKVALLAGNSPKIIHQHYRGLCPRVEMEAFMALTPSAVSNDRITMNPGGQGNKKRKLIP